MKICKKCESIAKWRIVGHAENWPNEVHTCPEHVERYLTNGCSVYKVCQKQETTSAEKSTQTL